MERLVLWLAAGAFVLFGGWALLDPVGMLEVAGVTADGPEGRVELRAMYGGLQLGFAVWLLWASFDPALLRSALVAGGLTLGGLGGARLVTAALEGIAPGIHHVFVVAELTGAILCLVTAARSPRR